MKMHVKYFRDLHYNYHRIITYNNNENNNNFPITFNNDFPIMRALPVCNNFDHFA